jgi:hypothetical protein
MSRVPRTTTVGELHRIISDEHQLQMNLYVLSHNEQYLRNSTVVGSLGDNVLAVRLIARNADHDSAFQDLHDIAFNTPVVLPILDHASDTDDSFDSQGTTQPWSGAFDIEPVVGAQAAAGAEWWHALPVLVLQPYPMIFTIFVEGPNTSLVSLTVSQTTTVGEIGWRYADVKRWWGARVSIGRLGVVFSDTATVSGYNVRPGDILQVIVVLRGGVQASDVSSSDGDHPMLGMTAANRVAAKRGQAHSTTSASSSDQESSIDILTGFGGLRLTEPPNQPHSGPSGSSAVAVQGLKRSFIDVPHGGLLATIVSVFTRKGCPLSVENLDQIPRSCNCQPCQL